MLICNQLGILCADLMARMNIDQVILVEQSRPNVLRESHKMLWVTDMLISETVELGLVDLVNGAYNQMRHEIRRAVSKRVS